MTIDTDGGLWVALWGGWAVHRYDRAGPVGRDRPAPGFARDELHVRRRDARGPLYHLGLVGTDGRAACGRAARRLGVPGPPGSGLPAGRVRRGGVRARPRLAPAGAPISVPSGSCRRSARRRRSSSVVVGSPVRSPIAATAAAPQALAMRGRRPDPTPSSRAAMNRAEKARPLRRKTARRRDRAAGPPGRHARRPGAAAPSLTTAIEGPEADHGLDEPCRIAVRRPAGDDGTALVAPEDDVDARRQRSQDPPRLHRSTGAAAG